MTRSLFVTVLFLLALPLHAAELPALASDEVRAIRAYESSGTAPVLYTGSIERYPYGVRTPVLTCAPLRVCAVVLEAGEIVWDVLSGDTAQWMTYEAAAGPTRDTPVVAVKPRLELGQTCDKTTNLVITTDRRIYQVILHLPDCARSEAEELNPQRPYDAVVSFYYPQDTLERWNAEKRRAELEAEREEARAELAEATSTKLAPVAVEELNWNYRMGRKGPRFPWLRKGPRFPWRPTAVFDDGVRTYVRLPEGFTEAPAAFVVTENGELTLLNYRLRGNLLILDRVVERFALTLPGPKKKPRKLLVTNLERHGLR